MLDSLALAHQVPEDWRAQAEVFNELFFVFLVVGTLVGVVVVSYTLYNAYKNRDDGQGREEFDAPQLGELPTGQEGGKSSKLFLSFGLSAIIVISLVVYSYGLLLYVEQGPSGDVADEQNMEVDVTGIQFIWQYEYPNGVETTGTMRVPRGELIRLAVTSGDVWHNFGVPDLRVKTDAIPGEYSHTWFIANETGSYTIKCYELCGSGHSDMTGEIVVMEQEEFDEWYESAGANVTEESTPTPTPGGHGEASVSTVGDGSASAHRAGVAAR
ncbi:cytochrome c oxidase subunit II [Natronomonas marina]|jgi:cytochrome c oxidase subunit 2|uniref:cytochrome c oxidase subunit II n=1 Tax=Natronomonas marina TaxID=2961939 RepID=UPI0020C9C684|nr:cytochrome c oxidase subunit II [Natronomonas marina]